MTHQYTYIARKKTCGCIVAAHVDDGSKTLKEWIGDWMIRNLTVERIPTEEARVSLTFCTHEEKQAELFT